MLPFFSLFNIVCVHACMYVCVCNTLGVEKTAQWLRAALIQEQGSISCTHICNCSPERVPGDLLSSGLHRYCTQWCTDKHAGKTPIHTKQQDAFLPWFMCESSEENFWRPFFFLLCMGSGDQIQGVKLGSNHLYILSHLAGPFPFLVIDCLPILA